MAYIDHNSVDLKVNNASREKQVSGADPEIGQLNANGIRFYS